LINLVSNAIKYNRQGGSVIISACESDGNVALRVSDTGAGLTESQINELGQPFSRLGAEHSTVQGSGLGLAITKSLVERMGGALEVSSTLGQGSDFSIGLLAGESVNSTFDPALDEEIRLSAFEMLPTAGLSNAAAGKVVMYVEDNALNRMVMCGLFEQRPDWRLLLASNGRECMNLLADTRPDLIMLDMRLPDCTGLELHARILNIEALAQIPVVAISADALPEKIKAAKAAGMLDYWVKPVDLVKVHQFLTQLSDHKNRQGVGPGNIG
jgi:CheY-like chemotaxis protein